MFLSFFVVCFSEVYSISLKSTDSQLLSLQESLSMFSFARSKLESQQKVNDLNPITLDLLPEEWVLSKLIKRSKFSLKKEVLSIQIITLKPISIFRDTINSMNIGILVEYSDGSIEILKNNGELLYEYSFGYSPRFIATTANYDEIKIAAISPENTLEIYDFYMERMKNNQTDVGTLVFNITKESSDVLFTSSPTSLIFYVKSGKKHWIVGDSEGKLSMHLMNGTFVKQENLNFGKITAIERFGQTIISSTENSVIAVNQNTLKSDIVCNDIGQIKDFCIDTASNLAYVYALTSNKITVLDTRHQKGNDIFCSGNY